MAFDISEPAHFMAFIAGMDRDARFKAKVRAAEVLLCGKDGDVVQARTQILNLALGHRQALEEESGGGTWSQSAKQLDDLVASASKLAGQFKHLKEGALRLLLAEACQEQEGLRDMADIPGLVPEWQQGQLLGAVLEGNVRWGEEGPATSGLDSSGIPSRDLGPQAGRSLGPRWIRRIEALATVCQEGAKIARERARKKGRRTAIGDMQGSPELQLLLECRNELEKAGRDGSKAFALAKAVHLLLTGRSPDPYWAWEERWQFKRWLAKVREWRGRESEAPDDIRILIEKGPQALPKRRSKTGA